MEDLKQMGLDVHKETIMVSVYSDAAGEIIKRQEIKNDRSVIRKFFKKYLENGDTVQAVYEAGCLGYELQRLLSELGVDCVIAAPAHIPRKPGKRIKNDRLDADYLALALKNGSIDPIYVPGKEDEAVRDFLRSRDDVRIDLNKARQRLGHFLLRHDLQFNDAGNWTVAHDKWLKSLEFTDSILSETFYTYYRKMKGLEDDLKLMDARIEEIAKSKSYATKVAKLRCFKGVDYLTALTFVVEVGDYRRFKKPEQFMSYLGLVPSEYSSGKSRKLGGITKTGNKHLRRIFIESAWHYRHQNISKRLVTKRIGQPAEIIAYADRALRRLNKKFFKMLHNGKTGQTTAVAVARELAGFVWGLMNEKMA